MYKKFAALFEYIYIISPGKIYLLRKSEQLVKNPLIFQNIFVNIKKFPNICLTKTNICAIMHLDYYDCRKELFFLWETRPMRSLVI